MTIKSVDVHLDCTAFPSKDAEEQLYTVQLLLSGLAQATHHKEIKPTNSSEELVLFNPEDPETPVGTIIVKGGAV